MGCSHEPASDHHPEFIGPRFPSFYAECAYLDGARGDFAPYVNAWGELCPVAAPWLMAGRIKATVLNAGGSRMKFDHSYWMDADERHADRPAIVCACCCADSLPEEMASPTTWTHLAEMEARFGGPVCDACADQHMLCDVCGQVTDIDDMTRSSAGDFCRDCAAIHDPDTVLGRRVDAAWEAAQ